MAWLVYKKKQPFRWVRWAGGWGCPTHPVSSFIPIHFNYAVIPTLFPVSWLAQPGNLQLIWPHLRFSHGGGMESSRNGMKCHSVVAFVTKMLGGDAEGAGEVSENVLLGARWCFYRNGQQYGLLLSSVLFVHHLNLRHLCREHRKKKSRSLLSSAVYQLVLCSSSRLLHLFHWGWAGCWLSPLALQCDAHNGHIRI